VNFRRDVSNSEVVEMVIISCKSDLAMILKLQTTLTNWKEVTRTFF